MRIFAGCLLLLLAGAAAGQKVVATESGDLLGTREPGVRRFLGVPYAAPPVGPLRWKLPQPVAKSARPLPADKPGPACTQRLSRSKMPWTEGFMVQNEAGEDCLSLNIWMPDRPGRHPVLVYLHGGGFVEGSNSIATYDGTMLARRGLLVVTVNYRLGVFGYLATSALKEEDGSAGNYAMGDQIAALKWVQRNIAAFGGDSSRVTLAGQSAGAESVAELLASPAARGLFQRAVIESDPLLWPAMKVAALEEAMAAGDQFTAAYGGSLAALRAVRAEDLLNAENSPPRRPVVDGRLLPEQPGEDLLHPVGSDVPVMLGWNADEGSASASYGKMGAVAFREDAQKRYGEDAGRFLKLYPAGDDEVAQRSQVQAARDRNFAIATAWAEAYQRRRSSAVYLYYFKRVPPWKQHPEFGAHHTAEVPYFFATLDEVKDRDYTDADYALSKVMSGQWVKFAETGRPTADWPAGQHGGGPFEAFGDAVRMESELDAPRAAFWRGVLLKK